MKRALQTVFCLFLCVLLLPLSAFAETAGDNYVTQTSMVRALQGVLQTEAPIGSVYSQKSPHGGASGNLGFAQTLFYRLFRTELSEDGNLSECEHLAVMSHFEAGNVAQAADISTARKNALRFGDLIQYGQAGHISIVLGSYKDETVVYDCGWADENNTVRLRFVNDDELNEQAMKEGDEGGLYFFRCKLLPSSEIHLNLRSSPKIDSYYLEAKPNFEGAVLEYFSEQTGVQEIEHDDPQLLTFASTEEAGHVPVLFLYGSALSFFGLEVKNQTVESISLETPPAKTEYTTEEEVDMSGAVVVAKMLDGTTLTLSEEEYTVHYAFTATGSAVVTVSYGGKDTTFSVTVKEPPVLRLSVVAPTKTTYYVGERIDFTGAYLLVDYAKETNVRKDILESMVSAYDTSLPGTVTVTVTYADRTASFDVEVVENKIASLRLATNLNKQYRKGSSIDLAKVELTVLYENGQSKTLSANDCVVLINGEETSSFSVAGEAEVVFVYNGVSTGTVAVNVTQDMFESILPTLIILACCLIGLPLLAFLILFILRRRKLQNEADDENSYELETAEEIASFDEEDEDIRIFEEKGGAGDTVALPKIATNVPSIRPAGEDPTMEIPRMPSEESPTIRIPKLPDADKPSTDRKIDFFDEL